MTTNLEERYAINLSSDECYEELIITAEAVSAKNVVAIRISHIEESHPSLFRTETECHNENATFTSSEFNYPVLTLWIASIIGEETTREFEKEVSSTYFKILRFFSKLSRS